MKRAERMVDLVQLLGGRRRVKLSEIVSRFGVSERTAYRDLSDLARRVVPVVREEGGYRLIEGATLRPLNLTDDERALLRALLADRRLGGLEPLAGRLAGLAAKLEGAAGRFGVRRHPHLAERDRTGPVPTATVRKLELAIDARHPVAICYHSLSSGSERRRRVDPYALFHHGAWYMVGRCHERAAPRTFRLDRIRSVELDPGTFDPPAEFDLASYLADSWEIYRGDEEHEVVLRFAPEVAALVLSGHHHDGESVEEEADGSAIYRVRLSHLEEMARWVLGFGGAVRVVGPEGLVVRVREMALAVLEGHGVATMASSECHRTGAALSVAGSDVSGSATPSSPRLTETDR